MMPIRRAGVVACLDWISRNHPKIRSLQSLDRDQFLHLATLYEASRGLRIDPSHQVYHKWVSTQWFFEQSQTDSEALGKLQ